MLPLYLIVAHLVGDYLFQSRWMADEKLHDPMVRAWHVVTYAVPFVPIAVIYSQEWKHAAAFMLWLVILHFATDSHRFRSTVGDVVQWRIDLHHHPVVLKKHWIDYVFQNPGHGPRPLDISNDTVRWPPPNPWPPMSLFIDQTLHLAQIALLAGLLLS